MYPHLNEDQSQLNPLTKCERTFDVQRVEGEFSSSSSPPVVQHKNKSVARARTSVRTTFVVCVDGKRYQNGRRSVPVNDRPSLSGRTRQTLLSFTPSALPSFFFAE
jgi:hypothetical protein